MKEDAIRFGVVGLGRAGWNIHVEQIRKRGDGRVTAVADPEAERRQQGERELGCRAYPTLEGVLKDPEVDVVVIATPSVTHAADTRAAFAAGKHVIVEKPMALNVAEADSMIEASQRAGKKLFIHHNHRFDRDLSHLREVIASGIIGRVFHIRANSTSFQRHNDWQALSKYGGGLLNNNGSHLLDMLLQLPGAPIKQVFGDLQRAVSAGDVEDHVKVVMRAENGCTIDMEISTAEAIAVQLPRWILCGTCGTLTSDGKTSTIKYFDPKAAPKLEVIDGPAKDRKYGNPEVLPWQEKTVPAVGPDVGDFYSNVMAVLKEGKPMWITPESVREVIRVIGMIKESARSA